MTAPSQDHGHVPPYLALVRIGAVIGMSTAVAFGIFLMIGGWWLAGLVAIALALPCFAIMRLAERMAGPPEAPPTS